MANGRETQGSVHYTRDRPLLHFGTPPAEAEVFLRMERMRRNGFILDVKGHEDGVQD